MGKVRDLAERAWDGVAFEKMNPLTSFVGLEVLEPGLAFISSFANVSALETDDGLLLVDTGGYLMAPIVHGQVRAWSKAPLHTAVHTHGHIDHVFGIKLFDAEAAREGHPRPRVIAHEAITERFERYVLTAGYNERINARQFATPGLVWPTEYRAADTTYAREMEITLGGTPIALHHARGETDDATWVWVAERKLLCCGDLFIWASPNCGNPQKAQRYPREWAIALRTMAALGAETLLPGHGPPIFGADRISQALTDAATLLESIVEQTLALMNAGARLDDILHTVTAPEDLLQKPYLKPVYDEPAFIVRNLWRLYGGWYDGNPAHLKPAPEAALAAELAALAGGAKRLVDRATTLAADGKLALAAQLAELAGQAAPDDDGVRKARAAVYRRRSEAEASLMARNIFRAASND